MTPDSDSLTQRTNRAAQWRLAGSLAGGLLQLIVSIPLARLLTPADFGVVALTNLVLAFAQPFSDLGLANAIVQRVRLSERQVRTAFTVSTLLGTAVSIALVAAAPLAALLTRTPQVASVLRILVPGFACRAAAAVADGLLRRRLDFKRQVIIEIGSYLLGYGGVAVWLASAGYGVWSLVWGSLVQMIASSAAQLGAVRHTVRPLIGRAELAELMGFGLGVASSNWVNYLALNGDDFIVGRLLGAASLGLYSRAYRLMKLPHTYVSTVMARVMLPVFAQVQNDRARLDWGYMLMTQLTAMAAAPALATMAVVAPHFVRYLYGDRWVGAVVPLQILCIAGYFRALYHLGGVLAQSVGRVYDELRRQILYASLVIVGALAGTAYDLAGVAVGVVAATIYMFIATGDLALRITGGTWPRYLQVQRGALATAAVTSGAALGVRLLLEARQASSAIITAAVLAAAAVPWSVAVLWMIVKSEPLRGSMPGWTLKFVEAIDGRPQAAQRR